MTITTAQITTAILDYMAALKARSWDNPNWSDSYKAQRRAGVLNPLRDRVTSLTSQARAAHDKAASLIDVAGLIDSQEDSQRLVARELAWQRMAPAVQSGDAGAVADLAAGASALELEALHMGITSLAATATGAGNQQYSRMLGAVDTAYPTSAGAPKALAEAAELVEASRSAVAYADAAEAVLSGQTMMEIGGEKLNGLYTSQAPEGRQLYDAITADDYDAAMAQAKADDAVHYDGKPESN